MAARYESYQETMKPQDQILHQWMNTLSAKDPPLLKEILARDRSILQTY